MAAHDVISSALVGEEADDVFDPEVGLFSSDVLRVEDAEEGQVGVITDEALLRDDIPTHEEH